MEFRELLTSRVPPLKMKVCASCVRSSRIYRSETRTLLSDVAVKFEIAEMQMIRWMYSVSMKNKRTSEELRKLVGVKPITTVIEVVGWDGMNMWWGKWWKTDWKIKVEGIRPIGRPRKTWLENVEADMAELEIDREDGFQIYRPIRGGAVRQNTIACKSRLTIILTVCCSSQRVFCLGSVRRSVSLSRLCSQRHHSRSELSMQQMFWMGARKMFRTLKCSIGKIVIGHQHLHHLLPLFHLQIVMMTARSTCYSSMQMELVTNWHN